MKPFLSYIGSKQKFMNKLDTLFPETINNYYEPFVGGGSVFFYLNDLEDYDIKHNYINDVDSDVIHIYKVIKNDTKK
ncbi:MAG TPA: modification methylase, partial [Flavobacterium sp.]|nr:modification methylase [Flavobacterium sp.]